MISVYKDFDDVPKGLENGDLTEAKQRLREIYYGKCAYTEQKISAEETYILRYRPISEYPWLEFEWSNLLPVCKMVYERLENYYKRRKFHVQGKKVTKKPTNKEDFKANSELMLSEKPLLLHPEIDTIENHFYLDLKGIIYTHTEKGKNTIEVFDLNKVILSNQRKKIIDTFKTEYHKGLVEATILWDHIIDKVLNLPKPANEFSFAGQTIYRDIVEETDSFIDSDFWSIVESLGGHQYAGLLLPNLTYNTNCDYERDALKQIKIKNYHEIKNITIGQNIPIDTHWIFFTGENGYGKTLLLQSIFIAFHGKKDRNIELADVNSLFIVEFQSSFGPKKRYMDNIDYIYGNAINIVAYGANRLNISGYSNGFSQPLEKENKSDSLFQRNGTLYNILEYLINLDNQKERVNFEKHFNEILEILYKLLPSIGKIEIDNSELKKRVFFREKAENGDLTGKRSFGELSAGIRNIIALVGDIIISLYDVEELEEFEDYTSISEITGIVLIDEIDAHLHPKWQRELVIKLTEIFPKVQFIASTHSPIPLLGAPKETVIFNVEKPDRKTGIQVRRLDIDVSQLTPNTILSSPIFGFDDIVSVSHQKEEKLYTQDSYNEVVFEKMLHKKLDDLAKEGGKSLEELLEL